MAGRRKKADSEAPGGLGEGIAVLPPTPRGAYKTIGKGGHSSLNEATLALVANSVALGNSLPRVCAAIGISKNTWHSWNVRGVADIRAGKTDTVAARWVQTMRAARSQAINSLQGMIWEAGYTDWRAASWLLERIAPEYRLTQKHEHALADKGKDMSSVPTAQLIALANKEPAPAEPKRGHYDPRSATFNPDDFVDGGLDDGDSETAAQTGASQEGGQGDC